MWWVGMVGMHAQEVGVGACQSVSTHSSVLQCYLSSCSVLYVWSVYAASIARVIALR